MTSKCFLISLTHPHLLFTLGLDGQMERSRAMWAKVKTPTVLTSNYASKFGKVVICCNMFNRFLICSTLYSFSLGCIAFGASHKGICKRNALALAISIWKQMWKALNASHVCFQHPKHEWPSIVTSVLLQVHECLGLTSCRRNTKDISLELASEESILIPSFPRSHDKRMDCWNGCVFDCDRLLFDTLNTPNLLSGSSLLTQSSEKLFLMFRLLLLAIKRNANKKFCQWYIHTTCNLRKNSPKGPRGKGDRCSHFSPQNPIWEICV